MKRIELTIKYLKQAYEQSQVYQNDLAMKQYRYEHPLRVAKLGYKLAKSEGLNIEGFMVACLLHDLSYTEEIITQEEWLNHGRRSVELSETFIKSLNFDEKTTNDILYAIAIHVDLKANFKGEENTFTLGLMDCDRLDQLGAHKTTEWLTKSNYYQLEESEQIKAALKRREDLLKRKQETYYTNYGKQLQLKLIDQMVEFLDQLIDNNDLDILEFFESQTKQT